MLDSGMLKTHERQKSREKGKSGEREVTAETGSEEVCCLRALSCVGALVGW